MSRLLRNPHARPPRGGSAVLTDGSPAGLVLRGLLFPASAVPAQATLYFVIYPAAQPAPTAAQIVAGQNSAGSAAVASGSESARSTTGEQIFANAAGGLAPSTSYLIAFVWSNGTSFSNVAVSASFSTAASGGNTFFRTNVGSVSIIGSIRRTSRVRRLGSLALAGVVRKLTRTRETGTLTPSGALRRLTRRILTGSLTLSAVLAAIKQSGSQTYQRAVGGTIALAGLVRKRSTRRLASAISAAGAVRKRSTRRLASTIAGITGSLRKFSRARVLTGGLTPSGTVSNRYVVLRFVSGSITVAGQVRKLTRRRLLATVTAAGALRKRTARRLVGDITMAGEIRKRTRRRLTATIVASGTAIRRFSFRVIAASVITVAGTLARLFSAASPFEPFSQRLTHLRRFIGRR